MDRTFDNRARYERFDESRTYRRLVGTLSWITTCGLALTVAVVRSSYAPWWGIAIAVALALQVLHSAWKTDAWELLYGVMAFMTAVTTMMGIR